MDARYWIVASLAMLLVALSKAGFGGGPGILATPMMAMVCKPATAIAVMLPVMIFCDIWCVIFYRKNCDWRKVFNLLAGFIIGVCIATFLLAKIPGQEVWLKKTIGLLAIGFGLSYFLLFRNKKIEQYIPHSIWFGVLTGIFAGVSSTLAHAAGPLVAMYLLSQGQQKDRFMGTIVVYSFIGNVLKIPSYLISGAMTKETFVLTWPLLLITPLGLTLGWFLNRKMSDVSFQGWISALLILIGLFLLIT